jgi:hypothetical protein
MRTLTDTIQLLKDVILDENCIRMNKSVVKGYLGELIVLKKLQSDGYKPEHFGNQSGFDIHLDDVKIDVKTSELKKDGSDDEIWGWALRRKDKPIKYDAAVCVALNKKLDVDAYYCIFRQNVEKFESQHERFNHVLNRFHKFRIPPDAKSSKKLIEAYEQSEQFLKYGKVIAITPDANLGEILLKMK